MLLSPEIAALAISSRSALVAINALMLKRAWVARMRQVTSSVAVLSPTATYRISLNSDERQGVELGKPAIATSFGQAGGSTAGDQLFGLTFLPNAPFMFVAVIVLGGLVASIGIPRPWYTAAAASRSKRSRDQSFGSSRSRQPGGSAKHAY